MDVWRFIMASVYTIRLWHKYTTRFPHDMFRPDGAIFRYTGVYTISFLLLPLGVRGMCGLSLPFFVKYIIYGMYKILNYYIKLGLRYLKY
jgi:hypothetical protein